MEEVKQATKDLIKEMRFAQVDDDEYIAFASRYQTIRNQLLEDKEDKEIAVLIEALDKAYERLASQLSFCTRV